jgi:hypothetical protein
MSLTVGPNLSSNYSSGPSGSAWIGRDTAAGRPSASSAEDAGQQTQTSQTTDQIDITSITVNITQGASGSGDDQLRLGVDKVIPTARRPTPAPTGPSTSQSSGSLARARITDRWRFAGLGPHSEGLLYGLDCSTSAVT